MTQQTVNYGSILSSGSKTKQVRPPIVIAYADRSLGKTTFGSKFPKPAFLCGEDGAHAIAEHRWPSEGAIETWGEVLNLTRAFANGEHDFKTLVVDTIGPVSTLCMTHIVHMSGKTSWEKMGWGKDQDLIREWRLWLSILETCRNKRGMGIVLLAHVRQHKINNTQVSDAYHVFGGDADPWLWAVTSNWADVVLYGAHGIRFEEQEHGKGRAVHDGTRWFYAQSDTGFEAKVRGGYWLPAKFELDYKTFARNIADTPVAKRARILDLTKKLPQDSTDPVVKNLLAWGTPASLATLEDDMAKLHALEVRVQAEAAKHTASKAATGA